MISIKDLSIKAIVIGFIVDFLGSLIVAAIVGFIVGFKLASMGLAISDQLAHSTGMQVMALAVGLFCSLLGGYIAALIAKENEIPNAIGVGVVSTIIGIFSILIFSQSISIWFDIAEFLLTIPAAFLGGYIRSQQR